jgi:hypothetical protein
LTLNFQAAVDLWHGSGLRALADDIDALKAALVDESARAMHAEAELAFARANTTGDQALITRLQPRIEKLTRLGSASNFFALSTRRDPKGNCPARC